MTRVMTDEQISKALRAYYQDKPFTTRQAKREVPALKKIDIDSIEDALRVGPLMDTHVDRVRGSNNLKVTYRFRPLY